MSRPAAGTVTRKGSKIKYAGKPLAKKDGKLVPREPKK